MASDEKSLFEWLRTELLGYVINPVVSWLISQLLKWISRLQNYTAPAILACYTSKRRHQRTDTESGPRGNFHVIKCKLWNNSKKTISNITVDLYCRSVNSKTQTYTDTGPIKIKFGDPLALNPGQQVELILLSQNETDANIIYLGDHKDNNVYPIKIVHQGEITHFITVQVGAHDMAPTSKNLVAITLDPPKLIALEYDSRRWENHDKAPCNAYGDGQHQ